MGENLQDRPHRPVKDFVVSIPMWFTEFFKNFKLDFMQSKIFSFHLSCTSGEIGNNP